MAVTVEDVSAPPVGRDHPGYRLAAGTELIGEYQDSGLQTPKYLIRRADGQVMQLPLLLYRVAGSLDGRDAGRIATELSAELGRELTPGQVAFLVEERLRPAGVVALDDGDADGARTPSPVESDLLLALRYRVGVVPAAVSWRVAGMLRPFFWRPVWLTVLTTWGVVLGLIVARGDLLGQALAGVDQLVRAPVLLLLIYLLTIVTNAFHEFGHVTACRYGGARPGDMGIGVYIVWPAFYSTVTDSYRLSRTGRLRTDLGGVYFDAVSMAGVGLLYLNTAEPWLVIALLGMLAETAIQFLPSIRLDGYYVLADLVGVPDLFGYVGPAVATLLPGRPIHPKVRELRPGARRVIVGWVALVVPALLGYLAVFLVALPHVLPVVWGALLDYLDTLDTALRGGDVVTVSIGVFQLLLLVLPWIGAVLMVGLVGRQLRQLAAARWGWAWAQPGAWVDVRWAARRAAVGGLAMVLLWRVAGVAASAPPSAAEARITAGALGVLQLGRDAAPEVAAGEGAVREQLVAYARGTGAFDRHGDALTGARELAVACCAVLIGCFLTAAYTQRWRPATVALPLAAMAAMGPAVTLLAQVGPGLVGATWVAVGATLLLLPRYLARGRHHLRSRRSVLLPAGLVAVLAGVCTAPLTAVPLALGAVLAVLSGGRRPHPVPSWTGLVLVAFGATTVAALTAPALLVVPAAALSDAERQVLLLGAGLVTVGVLAVRGLAEASVAGGTSVILALLPLPGVAAVLPLLVVQTAVLGALVVRAVTRQPVDSRPHPLLRAALAVPVLTVVVVGALFQPARAPDPGHRALAAWITAPASPAPVLEVPPALWADLVRDGVPGDRLRLTETPTRSPAGWTVTVGEPGLQQPRARLVFGEGPFALTVVGPG